jgi:hypothetical protein
MRLQPVHRARRFLSVLAGEGPAPADDEWAAAWLSEPERELFAAMAPVDRRHSIGVARAVATVRPAGAGAPGGSSVDWVMAAALLHDVGKASARLGILGRVLATLLGWLGGARWADALVARGGVLQRVGRYLRYPDLGAEALCRAGSDERVVAWAREHHRPQPEWTVPVEEGRLLRAADDGRL